MKTHASRFSALMDRGPNMMRSISWEQMLPAVVKLAKSAIVVRARLGQAHVMSAIQDSDWMRQAHASLAIRSVPHVVKTRENATPANLDTILMSGGTPALSASSVIASRAVPISRGARRAIQDSVWTRFQALAQLVKQTIVSLVAQTLRSAIRVRWVSSSMKPKAPVLLVSSQDARVAAKELICATRATVAT